MYMGIPINQPGIIGCITNVFFGGSWERAGRLLSFCRIADSRIGASKAIREFPLVSCVGMIQRDPTDLRTHNM